MAEGALVVWGTATQCSWWSRPAGGRALVGFWCAFVLLISAAFSGSIVAQMTRPRYEARLDTVRQLVEGGYRWISERNSSSWHNVYINMHDQWQEKWARLYQSVPPERQLEAVNSRRFALPAQRWGRDLTFISIRWLDLDRDLDDMRVMREDTSETRVGFIIAKSSPLQTVLQLTLLRFSEVGLFDFWASHTILKHGEKYSKLLMQERDGEVETSAKNLTLKNLSPAFIIVGSSLTASLLVFVAEVLWHRHLKPAPFPFIL